LAAALNDNNKKTMNWEGYGRKLSWLSLRHCSGIFLKGLRKIVKKFS
jgi:hypothetical protein